MDMYMEHATIMMWQYHHDSHPTASSSSAGSEELSLAAPSSSERVRSEPCSLPISAAFDPVTDHAVPAIEIVATSMPTSMSQTELESRSAKGLHVAFGCDASAE